MERVLLPDGDITIEGQFEPPVVARLSAEDQVFVMAFVQVHGSIKEMERIFGISYPTVKKRLDSISVGSKSSRRCIELRGLLVHHGPTQGPRTCSTILRQVRSTSKRR